MTIVTADSTKVEVDAAPLSEVRSPPFFFLGLLVFPPPPQPKKRQAAPDPRRRPFPVHLSLSLSLSLLFSDPTHARAHTHTHTHTNENNNETGCEGARQGCRNHPPDPRARANVARRHC